MANQKSPKEVAEKYVRRATNAVQDMVTGVKAVTENPMQAAIAKEAKLVQNWNASVTSGKWRRGMGTVSLDAWQRSMIEKGAQRVPAGVQAAQSKMEEFYAELLPYIAEGQKKLAGMADLTLEDALQRQRAWTLHMAAMKRRGG